MKSPAKLFVCEFITGGGFNHVALDGSLAHEGEMMRDALLRDLSSLFYEIYTTVDVRLDKPKNCQMVQVVDADDDVWKVWEQIIATVDMVWLVAPETDGALHKLTEIAVKQNKLVLGSDIESIKTAASKILTYEIFRHTAVAVLPTIKLDNWATLGDENWVVKPDDGAGCEKTFFFENTVHLKDWIAQNKVSNNYVIQPYQLGVPASISCVFHNGKAHLLSCNKQLLMLLDKKFSFKGVVVNGMTSYWAAFDHLANQVAQYLPGLKGYVGIDVIIKQKKGIGDEIILLEINPRLTTSYTALAEAMSINPANLIINTLMGINGNWPIFERNTVQVDL